MFKKVLIGLVVVLALLGAYVATRPDTYQVARSTTVEAPADIAFGLVNDFHVWASWSPWDKRDPSMTKTYDGPPSGTGAHYAWSGNKDVGQGQMTITGSQPAEAVHIALEFIKPFPGKSETDFTFKPSGQTTTVTWSMTGHANFMGKAMGLVMNMDSMIGKDFEAGLASIKTLAETEAHKRAVATKTAAAAPSPVAHGSPSSH